MQRTIAVVNRSAVLTEEDFGFIVAACDRQLERHVAPLWGMRPLPVRAYRRESDLPAHCLPIRIVDAPLDEEDEEAFGWHFEEDDGQPFGRVFVDNVLAGARGAAERERRIRTAKLSVSAVLSHEVIEAFVDPDINLWAYDPEQGELHAYEVCDPVQSMTYVIQVPGARVRVSNFVTPAWFDRENRRGARLDYLGTRLRPFRPVKGGYTTVLATNAEEVTVMGYGGALPSEKKHRAARTALRRTMECVCKKAGHAHGRGGPRRRTTSRS